MNAKPSQISVAIDGDAAGDEFHQRLAAALVLLCVVLLSATAWFVNEVKATHAATIDEPAAAAQTSTSQNFEYFPSRFVNQASDVEEHIQAF